MKLKPLVKPGSPEKRPGKTIPSLLSKELLPVWSSSGVREKPQECQNCAFRLKGSGFVPDWYPTGDVNSGRPVLGLLLDMPTSDEVVEQKPWAGRAGWAWENRYLRPFGLSRDKVYIGHVIRCQPKDRKFGRAVYPVAPYKGKAERACRAFDDQCWGGQNLVKGGLLAFNPNLFVVTFHPHKPLEVPALAGLIESDMRRAVQKMKEGFRPLVLMGDEAKDLVAPWLSGSVKNWRGHYWEGELPWLGAPAPEELSFLEV